MDPTRRLGSEGAVRVTIAFYLPPQVHILDACGPIHVFYEAQEMGASLDMRFLSVGSREVETSSGLFFSRVEDFRSVVLQKGDYLFIPGLIHELWNDDDFHRQNADFYAWVREMHGAGVLLAAVCTGSFVLAETGLLDGRSCTTHWRYLDRFTARFPKTQAIGNRLFVEQDHIYTSAGVTSGIDLALYLVEQLFGSDLALRVAREVVIYFRRGEEDPQLSIFLQYRNHIDDRIHLVQDIISTQLEKKHTIEALADEVNTSPRNLTRLFKKTTGITLGEYTDQLRLERARQLLKAGHKVEYVARKIGFVDSNQLRAVLKKHGKPLPSEH